MSDPLAHPEFFERSSNLTLGRAFIVVQLLHDERMRVVELGISTRFGNANTLLLLKDETLNPTRSFKDRCSTVSISKALEAAAPGVVIASSGGAAASACAHSTVADMPCYVFVPPNSSLGRLLKIHVFGG